MKHFIWIGLTLAWLFAVTWWWHADVIEQITYENQAAARLCWKRYDEAAPGPNFHEIAEGNVERCYDAMAHDLKDRLQQVTWWGALAAGAIPPLIAWSGGLILTRWRRPA